MSVAFYLKIKLVVWSQLLFRLFRFKAGSVAKPFEPAYSKDKIANARNYCMMKSECRSTRPRPFPIDK